MSEAPAEHGGRHADVVRLDRRTLLARHLAGDESAFAELVQEFRTLVYSYIVRCGVLPEARDDLFQEIFLKVHRAAHTYQPERALEPWMFTIVANTVRSYYRKQAVRQRVYGEQADEPIDASSHNAEDTAQARETAQWLESEIQRLPFAQREVIVLCCFDDFSQKDAAETLGIPVNTLKTHLRRGRTALSKALARRKAAAQREVRV